MIPTWALLDERDQATFRAVVAFISKRLAERATVDWALRLKPIQHVERAAIDHSLDGTGGRALAEPWASAWHLIEESWSGPIAEHGPSLDFYGAQARLRAGERSGVIVTKIVDLVSPRLVVEPLGSRFQPPIKRPRSPKSVDQLLSARISSGSLIKLRELGLDGLTDMSFLLALGGALESAVNHGLEIARRLGWEGQTRFWKLGEIGRVYYVHGVLGDDRNEDPDTYRRGMAPAVKLLSAVVTRICELNPQEALRFAQRWSLIQSPIHIRLWAAAARNPELASPEQLGIFLSSLVDQQFWDVYGFPEVAEVRALRFNELNAQDQKTIAKRLRKGPPRNIWPKTAEREKIADAQTYWTVRELKRIQVAGGGLPLNDLGWLEAHIGQFANLAQMTVDYGAPKSSKAQWVVPNPDSKFDSLDGIARLRALEAAFSTSRGGWSDDPAERANEWLLQPEKALLVLDDLEAAAVGSDEFPLLWNRFGWAHSPKNQGIAIAPGRALQVEANRVIGLLNQMPEGSRSKAIEGITAWLDAWKSQVVASRLGLSVWLRFLPIAVQATNSASDNAEDFDLSVSVRSSGNDNEPMDLDTLNTPIGRLTGVFLETCPSLAKKPSPFKAGSKARKYRDAVIGVIGRSGLIVRHRLIEILPYFLRADRTWTQEHLIEPLLRDDAAALALWRAIARRTHYSEVLKIIGDAMCERATDRRLGRETRQMLVFSLVIESLYAFLKNREPAVPNPRIQQMLRTVEDEVRASAANAVRQFVKDLSSPESDGTPSTSVADLFRSAAAPFLKKVWPQERSLVTPGVSGAFANLPATSGDIFVEAVDAIERFLVPFKCWSMLEFGLYGESNGKRSLGIIDDEAKARALLRLLDLTIGSSEGAVVPYDLTEALDQIQSVAPTLTKNSIYGRLSTAARR